MDCYCSEKDILHDACSEAYSRGYDPESEDDAIEFMRDQQILVEIRATERFFLEVYKW